MRRLKTLLKDPVARAAVSRVSAMGSEDSMHCGLLCYEAGRVAGRAELEEVTRALVFEATTRPDRRPTTGALDTVRKALARKGGTS